MAADPDRGATFEVGGVGLLPGECAVPGAASSGARWVRVRTEGTPGKARNKTLRVSGSRLPTVVLEAPLESDRARLRVHRRACPAGQTVEAHVPGDEEADD